MSSTYLRTGCFFNLTTDERIEIFQKKRALRLDWVYKTFFGWMAIPFASIALTLTVIYVIVVFNAIKQRRVSRKCYILLLNRAIGDVLACITCLIGAGYVLLTEKANRDVVSIMDTFFIASFWSAMVSYVSLSVLKLYAVAKPFNYRRAVTMKRCIHLMIFSWVVFLFMVAYALTVTALVKIPVLNEWSGCKMETCLRRMYQSRNLLTIIVYFLTIISFFITVFFIRRAQRFVDSFHRNRDKEDRAPKRARFPLWKLALNVGTFGFLYIFYVLWGILLLINRDQCFFQRNFAEMIRILGLIRLTLLIRILIDPVISFITDFQIRRGMLELFHIKGRRVGMDSRNKIFQKSASEENSSSANNGQSVKASDTGAPEQHRTQSVKTVA
ncbi:hypothetical protein QR680_004662 [Steinernema hermaphroditum]|uniref:G-protein coupled receptors family 1 profile domain-containing protein n=1 Tax=Steinernema hermaphroditum TaxID=289476 RepID=A0AA39HQV3_9BILA|nr:hypothetical protein QR680_004662 [Steinernema hermaphroditum]